MNTQPTISAAVLKLLDKVEASAVKAIEGDLIQAAAFKELELNPSTFLTMTPREQLKSLASGFVAKPNA